MNWNGIFELSCTNSVTGHKWSDIIHNDLANEGERNILDAYLRGQNIPTTFYLGLTSMASISEDTTLATLTNEASGTGYLRQEIGRSTTGWPQLQLDAGDGNYQSISKVISFSAAGNWTMVNKLFMCTSLDNSGLLISYGSLSTARTLVENDILDITYKIKLA